MRRLSTWMCLLSLCCTKVFAAQVIVNDFVDIAQLSPILLPNLAVQYKDWSLFAIEVSYKFQW